ncbi:UNVERIFIED_CONTAM: hypothetical protein Sangu_3239200 [Sesamum angustifolium]|uniref:DUF4283 domain-containing protein n=1 Tax=Sesamum angustifolium TaxID=2727405 RepID=A0AAW2JFF6_9LAMI
MMSPPFAMDVVGMDGFSSPPAMAMLPTSPEAKNPPRSWVAPPLTSIEKTAAISSLLLILPLWDLQRSELHRRPCRKFLFSSRGFGLRHHSNPRPRLFFLCSRRFRGPQRHRCRRSSLQNRWNKSLNTTAVGYFLGKRPYFHHLTDFVRSIWPAVRDVKATSNGFFFFQFKTVAAMEEVLEGGPWLYLGQPIVLQKMGIGYGSTLGHATKECPLTKPVKPAVSIYVRKNQTPAPAPRTGDPIPNSNLVFEHPGAKDDMGNNERPHQRMDKGKQIVIYNAFDILRDADEDADESIRGPNTCTPRMFPHVEHNDLECSGPQQEGSSGRRARPCLRIQMEWFVDYSGPGNRIWIAWNDDFIDVDILSIGSQFVHCRVLMHDMHEHILITVVYGANEVSARREYGRGLLNWLCQLILPWLVGGDFNAVLDMSEVSGASGAIRVAMHEFNDCIIQTGLISLPMQGERFSWHNCSTGWKGAFWKRLDRNVC